MTSRERVLTTLARQPADRVPINYSSNPGIDGRLKAHYGLGADDAEGLRQKLGGVRGGRDRLGIERRFQVKEHGNDDMAHRIVV